MVGDVPSEQGAGHPGQHPAATLVGKSHFIPNQSSVLSQEEVELAEVHQQPSLACQQQGQVPVNFSLMMVSGAWKSQSLRQIKISTPWWERACATGFLVLANIYGAIFTVNERTVN